MRKQISRSREASMQQQQRNKKIELNFVENR